MKTLLSMLLFYVFAANGITQTNLVPNPSFEDKYTCPSAGGELNKCKNWFNPSSGSPDYFHSCSSLVGVPYQGLNYQFAKDGDAFVGVWAYQRGFNTREYIEVKLNSILESGKSYRLCFYINLMNLLAPIGNFHAAITIDSIYDLSALYFQNIPEVKFEDCTNLFRDTLNWIKFEGIYTAIGGEKYLTIGNFFNDTVTCVDTSNSEDSYYFIDDVYLGLVEDTIISEISFYPNPNNGHFTLNYNLGEGDNGFAEIYNSIGQKVFRRDLLQNNGVESFELSLSAGCYLLQIVSGEAVLRNEKLIILR